MQATRAGGVSPPYSRLRRSLREGPYRPQLQVNHPARVAKQQEDAGDAGEFGVLLEVGRNADLLVVFVHLAANDDADVHRVQADEEDGIDHADAAAERHEEGVGRRGQQERDFGCEVAVYLNLALEESGLLDHCGVLGAEGSIHGEQRDARPAR